MGIAVSIRVGKVEDSSFGCALSSVVEHYLHTVGVAGSKPAARTIPPLGDDSTSFADVQLAPFVLLSNRLGAVARASSRQRAKISDGDSHCSANSASACVSAIFSRRMMYFTSGITAGAQLNSSTPRPMSS